MTRNDILALAERRNDRELIDRLRRYAMFYSADGWRAQVTVVSALNEAADRILELNAKVSALRAYSETVEG
jgi:hypothetical protein